MHRPRTHHHRSRTSDAIIASLIACLLVLPTVRSAGEVHHSVAHVEQPEWHVHTADAHSAHAEHAASTTTSNEHADASAMHLLMHLPAAGADTVALAYAQLTPRALANTAPPPPAVGPFGNTSPEPTLPYRPPILG